MRTLLLGSSAIALVAAMATFAVANTPSQSYPGSGQLSPTYKIAAMIDASS